MIHDIGVQQGWWAFVSPQDGLIAELVFHIQQIEFVWIIVLAVLMVMMVCKPSEPTVDAPVVGRSWRWEPTWCTRLRFLAYSQSIIKEGYTKVSESL